MEVYSSSDYLPVRALAHRLKDGDKEGITKAAAIMADLVKSVPDYQHSILVPMPGRKGSAGYTKVLADEIAGQLGLEVSDILTVKPHKPLYDRKAKKGIDGLKPFKFVVNDQIPEDKKPILVTMYLIQALRLCQPFVLWMAVQALSCLVVPSITNSTTIPSP